MKASPKQVATFDRIFELSTELNFDPRFIAHADAVTNSIAINPTTKISKEPTSIGVAAEYSIDNGGVGFGGTYRSKHAMIYFGKVFGYTRDETELNSYITSHTDLTDSSFSPFAWACSGNEGYSDSFSRSIAMQQGRAEYTLDKDDQIILGAKASKDSIPGLGRFAALHAQILKQPKGWREYSRDYNDLRRDFRATEQFMRHIGLSRLDITSWLPIDYENTNSLVVRQLFSYPDHEAEKPDRTLEISFEENEADYVQIKKASGQKITSINSFDTKKLLSGLEQFAKLARENPSSYVYTDGKPGLLVSHMPSVVAHNKSYLQALPGLQLT